MMKPISLLLRALIGVALVTLPLAADAKPKKDDRKKKKPEAAEAQKKTSKSSQRSVQRPASRPKAQAKASGKKKKRAPERRTVSKSSRSKSSGNEAQQRRASASSKPPKKAAAKAQNRRKAAPMERAEIREPRPQRELTRAEQREQGRAVSKRPDIDQVAQDRAEKQARAAEKKERSEARAEEARETRTEKIADRREARAQSEQEKQLRKSERADNRADRREAREESAEERDRRAERMRERQRVAPHRQRQIAERREQLRDRVERFRDNRQDRLAAVLRQRRAIRATRVEARREYVHEVREEIRDYWEDRAEETRYHVRDRCDHLFDDAWWEDRNWRRGPILVSDPWWWWRPARFDAINVFIDAGWSEPVVYDYGTDVIYDQAVVHVRGEPVGTRQEYSRGVVQLANPVIQTVAQAPLAENEWRSLGVWALVQEAQGDAVMFFQLSVDRQGLISGAYTNVVSGEELPVTGQVDRATQRAAWHIGEQTKKVFEAGLTNLTQDQASCLVHFEPGEMQTWLLVRLPNRSLPNQPANLSAGSDALLRLSP